MCDRLFRDHLLLIDPSEFLVSFNNVSVYWTPKHHWDTQCQHRSHHTQINTNQSCTQNDFSLGWVQLMSFYKSFFIYEIRHYTATHRYRVIFGFILNPIVVNHQIQACTFNCRRHKCAHVFLVWERHQFLHASSKVNCQHWIHGRPSRSSVQVHRTVIPFHPPRLKKHLLLAVVSLLFITVFICRSCRF